MSTYFTFEDVKVPVENLIGKEDEGFKVFMASVALSTLLIRFQSRETRNCNVLSVVVTNLVNLSVCRVSVLKMPSDIPANATSMGNRSLNNLSYDINYLTWHE